MSFNAANPRDVAPAILSAYKRGFRIVFMLSAALAALAFLFATVLMPQIEIKHEKKVENDESERGSQVLVDEKIGELNP